MDDLEQELKEGFLQESVELLEGTEQAFLQLEKDKNNPDLLNKIFRFAHNLKGTSRAVGFGDVAEFTHEMENLILKLKEGSLEVTDEIVSLLLECNDHINKMIYGLREDLNARFESKDITAKILLALDGKLTKSAEAQDDHHENHHEEVPQHENNVASNQDNHDNMSPHESAVSSNNENNIHHSQDPFIDSLGELLVGVVQGEQNPHSKIALEVASDKSGAKQVIEKDGIEISHAALDSLKELGIEIPEMNIGQRDLDSKIEVLQSNKKSSVAQVTAPEQSLPKDATVVSLKDANIGTTNNTNNTTTNNTTANNAHAENSNQKKSVTEETLRVSMSKVNKLNDIVGELVIVQTVLEQMRYFAIKDEMAIKAIGQLNKLSKEIQEISMGLCLVPVKPTFQKMTRIVRDTSKALNKQVELILEGEETEIDKTVLEYLADPLVHIVRNAVDHGLESTEDRIKSGKSIEGKIKLKASHSGNNLLIEVSDDGKGINSEIIYRKAVEKKVIAPNTKMTEKEIINLIFHAGFSTKDQVSEVSGRGVGMDVVKNNIEKLSGHVEVTTEVGKGSIFKITLPLTMAIIEGMIIKVSNENFVVPLDQIVESMLIRPESISTFTGVGSCMNLRGQVYPLLNIATKLNLKDSKRKMEEQIAIIVNNGREHFAVVVDDIVRQQQVVIKKIGDEIKGQNGFMGSTILGDGKPAIILDLFQLFSAVNKSTAATPRNSQPRMAA